MTEKITSSEIRVLSSAFYSDSYSETPCISATYSRAFHPWRRTWEFLLPTTRQPTQPQTSRWSMRIWHDAVHDKLMSMTSWMISSNLKWPFLQQFANQKRNSAPLPLFLKECWLTPIFGRALSTDQLLHLQPSSSSSSAGEKLTWFWIQCFMIVYLWVKCVCFQSDPYSKPIRVEYIWTSWGLQGIQENQGLWGLSGNHWRWFREPHRLGTKFRSRNVPIGFDIPNRRAWAVRSLTGFEENTFVREKKFLNVHIKPVNLVYQSLSDFILTLISFVSDVKPF